MMDAPPHIPDGSDDVGAHLPITIRIGPDGRLYLHDLTHDLLPVAAALCPLDAALQQRVRAAAEFAKGSAL